MIDYIGNCSNIINWDEIILQCANSEPDYIGPSHKKEDNIPGLDQVATIWEKAGYKNLSEGGTVGWGMFIPGKQFDERSVTKFCELFKIDQYHTAWISKINVGHFAPWHWDVNDHEVELSKLPPKVRFHSHISKPQFGHVFIANGKCFYNQQQGSTYKWGDRRYWHAGTNCGLEPKYIFNLW